MSRSSKHLSITGIAVGSDKQAKRTWNRWFRRMAQRGLRGAQGFDALVLPIKVHKDTEYWDGPKETKVWRPTWPKGYRK